MFNNENGLLIYKAEYNCAFVTVPETICWSNKLIKLAWCGGWLLRILPSESDCSYF